MPAASIGGRYQPSAALAGPKEREGYSFVKGQPETFSLGSDEVQWLKEITNYSKLPYLHVNADHTRAYETNGCGAFVLNYRGAVSSPPMNGILGMAGSGSKKVPGIEIPKGTPLVWPGGGPAGIVAETFTQGGARRSAQPLTCLKVPFGTKLRTTGYLASTVTVCVKSSAVRRVQTAPPRPKGIRSADNSIEVLR